MNNSSFFEHRLSLLRAKLKLKKIKYFLVSNPANLEYLTGFRNFGSQDRQGYLLLGEDLGIFFLSPLLAHPDLPEDFQSIALRRKGIIAREINRLISEPGAGSVAVEASDLKLAEFTDLGRKIKTKLTPTRELVEDLRQVKDDLEISSLGQACKIAKGIFTEVNRNLKPGRTEKEIASIIIDLASQLGAEGMPAGFPPIVASGPNSAIPHYRTGDRKLQNNDVILIDFGCLYHGYCSDISRTVKLGKKSAAFTKVEQTVQEAYRVILSGVREKSPITEICRKAQAVFSQSGFSSKLPHALGHGVGLEVHERPLIFPRAPINDKPQVGMTLAIEPAIYLPGEFGYRYENTVLVTKQGVRTLT